MSIDFKCAITVAILSVLVYLLMLALFQKSSVTEGVGKSINETEWYKSNEIIILVSVFIGYSVNSYLFASCSP